MFWDAKLLALRAEVREAMSASLTFRDKTSPAQGRTRGTSKKKAVSGCRRIMGGERGNANINAQQMRLHEPAREHPKATSLLQPLASPSFEVSMVRKKKR